jgi:mannobiose 2-epimerase
MRYRFFLALVLVLVLGDPAVVRAQPADSLLQGDAWRSQGLRIMEAWTQNAQTPDGLLYAELDRAWTPTDSTTQYPGMLARHLYSYSAAYLMSGYPAHLRRAAPIVDFLIEHGWDDEYGGWYNAVTRNGKVVDADKDLFMQIYATTGLALYSIVTRDERARAYLERSRTFMQDHAWDDRHGGYVDVLTREGSVKHA